MFCKFCKKNIKDEEYESHEKICSAHQTDFTPKPTTYIAGGIASAAIGGIAAPTVISAAGFGSLGPAAGTAAAAWQASIGNVAAGSLFATLQSAGMGGAAALGAVVGVSIVSAGVIGLGGIGIYHLIKKLTRKSHDQKEFK